MIPGKAFLVKGKGVHEKKLVSFELVLRNAGMEKFNLSPGTIILLSDCKIVPRKDWRYQLRLRFRAIPSEKQRAPQGNAWLVL